MFAFSQGLLLGCFGWFGNGTIIFNMNPTILVFLPKLASVQTCLTFSNEGKMQIAKAPIVWHGMIQINEEKYHLVPACRELKENTRKISSHVHRITPTLETEILETTLRCRIHLESHGFSMATVDPLAYGILHCFTHLTGKILATWRALHASRLTYAIACSNYGSGKTDLSKTSSIYILSFI